MSEETVHLHIEGMTCPHCVETIQQALVDMPGVSAATVDLEEAEAVVRYDPDRVEPEELLALVEQAGYSADVM